MTSRKKSTRLIFILALLLGCLFAELVCKKQGAQDSEEYTQETNDNTQSGKNNSVTSNQPVQEEKGKKDITITADMITLFKNGNQKVSGIDWDFPVKQIQDCQNGIKVNINAANPVNDGLTTLHYACFLDGSKDLIKVLINRGANLEAKDNPGFTPLSIAAWYGSREAVQALIEAGASLDVKQKGSGFTPLHLAINKGYLEITKMLLTAKADKNAQTSDGNTPLHYAASRRYIEIVEALLAAGANKNVKNKNGYIPIQLTTDAQVKKLLK